MTGSGRSRSQNTQSTLENGRFSVPLNENGNPVRDGPVLSVPVERARKGSSSRSSSPRRETLAEAAV